MEVKQAPNCVNDAQSLSALVKEMTTMLSSPTLDNGGVLVGVLPKHRCCDGSYHMVVPREGKNDGVVPKEEVKNDSGVVPREEVKKDSGVVPRENKHSLEGVWEGAFYGIPDMVLVRTVQDKPGYLFGVSLIGNRHIPAKQVMFWVKSGSLEGKVQVFSEYIHITIY